MSVANTIPNRINVVIYLKSIFFLEKFAYTDIEISENKKTIRDFRSGCLKVFYSRLPRLLKAIKAQKRTQKSFFIIAGKSEKILPAVSSERMPFHKLAENKAVLIQTRKVGRPFHLFLKKQT